MNNRTYVCIDLKSFYASVECVARGLDPFSTNLVVADPERTEKTICLAVSPHMKALGVPGRCRVFEIPKDIPYIMAEPRMQTYIDKSAEIYGIYLQYIAKEDIHVYSIDEVFMDVTQYLSLYNMTAKELAVMLINKVFEQTGITATAGIGTNLYLAKIAMDIVAKHVPDHIGELNEESYRARLWDHTPITDFWRIGRGIANRLARSGLFTMGDIAAADEELIYHLFGIDAELIIDHAWGRETATMEDIKSYKPKTNCISSGQVLPRDYGHAEGKLIIREMIDRMCLELVGKDQVTESVSLYLGYSSAYMKDPDGGTAKLPMESNSSKYMMPFVDDLYERVKDPEADIRRVSLSFNNIRGEDYIQYDLFTKPDDLERDRKMQKAVLTIEGKYGKNAILKGMNLTKEGMTVQRNSQIGGHKTGDGTLRTTYKNGQSGES